MCLYLIQCFRIKCQNIILILYYDVKPTLVFNECLIIFKKKYSFVDQAKIFRVQRRICGGGGIPVYTGFNHVLPTSDNQTSFFFKPTFLHFYIFNYIYCLKIVYACTHFWTLYLNEHCGMYYNNLEVPNLI